MGNNLEFLDILAIISFTMQLQNTAILRKQATNDEVISDIHDDIMLLDKKLDKLLELLSNR